MKKLLLAGLIFVSSLAAAELYKTIGNPNTGKPDYVTKLDSTTVQAGSNVTVVNTSSGITISASGGGGGGGTTIWSKKDGANLDTSVSTINFQTGGGLTATSGPSGQINIGLSANSTYYDSAYNAANYASTGSVIYQLGNYYTTGTANATFLGIGVAATTYQTIAGFSGAVNGAGTVISTTTNFINNQSASVESKTFNVSSGTALQLGASTITIGGVAPTVLASNPLRITDSQNNFYQANIQNKSAGNNASADWVATNDLGSDTSGYFNCGINSSGYNQASFNVTGSSDSYCYASNMDFILGTADPGADAWIKLFTGGTTSDKIRFQITNTGVVSIPGTQLSVNGTTYTWNVGSGGAGQFIQNNGGTLTSATPAGGSGGTPPSVAIATGSPMGFNTAISSPVAVVLLSTQNFQAQLQGGATAYITYRSTITSDGVPEGASNLYFTSARVNGSLTNPTTMFIANGTSFQNANFNVNTSSSMRVLTSSLSVVGGASISTITVNPLLDAATAFQVLSSTGLNVFTITTSSANIGDSTFKIIVATTASYSITIGTATLGGPYLVFVSTNGHVNYEGPTPAVSSCGTSPTLSLNMTDIAGTITPGATATGCTITFANAWKNVPNCQVTEQTLSLVNALNYTITRTALTISQTALTSLLNYQCTGAD